MPRRKAAPEVLVDDPMPGLENLKADPAPPRGPGRPAKTTTAKATSRARAGTRSTAQLRSIVETQLLGIGTMLVGIWGLKDPCAEVMTEHVDAFGCDRLTAIVRQAVDIMAENDKVLAAMAEAGLVTKIALMVSTAAPVAARVWRAHGPGGHGHDIEPQEIDYGRYPAPALS